MRRRIWVLLVIIAALTAAGCARRAALAGLPPLDAAALADPGPQGARYALDRYLNARSALDYRAVYEVLTQRTQQAYSVEQMKGFFKDYLGYSAGGVTDVVEVADKRWVRFAVATVRWHLKGRPPTEGDAWYITAHFDGARWGIALADPLTERAGAAVAAGSLEGLSKVADEMLAVDPFSFRAHVQKSQVHLYSDDPNAALDELRQALAVVPPPAAPEVFIPLGDLFRSAEEPDQAAQFYRLALDGMYQYAGLYDNGLTAGVNRALALTSLQAGDTAGARRAAAAAQLQSPFDGRHHALAGAIVTR